MRPLLLLAYGFLVVGVQIRYGRYDVFADPVGKAWTGATPRLSRAVREAIGSPGDKPGDTDR